MSALTKEPDAVWAAKVRSNDLIEARSLPGYILWRGHGTDRILAPKEMPVDEKLRAALTSTCGIVKSSFVGRLFGGDTIEKRRPTAKAPTVPNGWTLGRVIGARVDVAQRRMDAMATFPEIVAAAWPRIIARRRKIFTAAARLKRGDDLIDDDDDALVREEYGMYVLDALV